jgi:hypothetical protein
MALEDATNPMQGVSGPGNVCKAYRSTVSINRHTVTALHMMQLKQALHWLNRQMSVVPHLLQYVQRQRFCSPVVETWWHQRIALTNLSLLGVDTGPGPVGLRL